MPQESNLDQNKIVVGIRFVKRHRVIHLEIQQVRKNFNFTKKSNKCLIVCMVHFYRE